MMTTVLAGNSLLIFKIVAAVVVGFLVVVAGLIVRSYYGGYKAKMTLEDQLRQQLSPDYDETVHLDKSIRMRWNKYWEKALIDSGANILSANRQNAGNIVLIGMAAITAVLTVLFRGQILGAIIITLLAVFVLGIVLSFMADKRIETLTNEIPQFISGLIAADQTSNSPRVVLQSGIRAAAPELHEELVVIENKLHDGAGLKDTLEEYVKTSPIFVLRFLMICIILASDANTSMTPQLKKIQEIVDARQRVDRARRQAVASIMPTIWVSTIFIPAMFLYTYILQPIARAFWFHTLFSWLIFLVVIVLYCFGIWVSKHLVDKIKNM